VENELKDSLRESEQNLGRWRSDCETALREQGELRARLVASAES
jgi:hypothetical protein